MAKKKIRSKYTSKAQRSNSSEALSKAVRRDITYLDRLTNQLKAWSKGRKTKVTIENPNPQETNKRFIKVEGNVFFGPWKRTGDVMGKNSND